MNPTTTDAPAKVTDHNHPALQRALLAYERGWRYGMFGAQHKAALVAVIKELENGT